MGNRIYILFNLARERGYGNPLCLLLHAKEVECLNFYRFPMKTPPFVSVLEEGIEDHCAEAELVKMALGNMDYSLRADDCVDDKTPREMDREFAIESGEKNYKKFLASSGAFDYVAYFARLKKSRDGKLAKILDETQHPLLGNL